MFGGVVYVNLQDVDKEVRMLIYERTLLKLLFVKIPVWQNIHYLVSRVMSATRRLDVCHGYSRLTHPNTTFHMHTTRSVHE